MALSLTEVIALRRLAGVYRRILLLAVPVALAACQDGADPLAPADSSVPLAEAPATEGLLAAASLDRIAFVTDISPDEADIWTMNPNGTGQTRLTSFAGKESRPIWSPDHGRIAFLRTRSGKTDVYLMKADGTNKHWALTSSPGYNITAPSWAPDGKSIVAELWLTSSAMYVIKIDLATGQWSHLFPAGRYGLKGRSPVYSKDGLWLYYMDQSLKQLHRFQPNGQDVLLNTWTNQLSSSVQVSSLAMSPEGARLAYTMYSGGSSDIYVLNLVAMQIKRLTYHSAPDGAAAWSPDGNMIVFRSNRAGVEQVFTMNSSDGGNVKKLTSKLNGAGQPTWYR